MAEQETKELKERVAATLNNIRPHLQADGGDVELVDVANGIVKVRLKGACHGCPMAAMTLQMGIERVLRKEVPEIQGVENVTD